MTNKWGVDWGRRFTWCVKKGVRILDFRFENYTIITMRKVVSFQYNRALIIIVWRISLQFWCHRVFQFSVILICSASINSVGTVCTISPVLTVVNALKSIYSPNSLDLHDTYCPAPPIFISCYLLLTLFPSLFALVSILPYPILSYPTLYYPILSYPTLSCTTLLIFPQ